MAKALEVRRIEAGEIITEPGIYDMPIRWYHDNCCDGLSVSSSGLRTIMLRYEKRWPANSRASPA